MYTNYYSQQHKTLKYKPKEGIKMSVLLMLWEILVNTVENVIYALLFMHCLVLRKYLEQYKVAFFFSIVAVETALTCLCNILNGDAIFTQLLLLIADCLLILCIFEDSLSKKTFIAIIPTFISILADRFTFAIGDLVAPDNVANFIFEGYHRYCSTLIYLCFCVILYLIFRKLFQNDIYLTSSLRLATYISVILSIIFTNFFLDIIMSSENYQFSAGMRHRIQLLSVGFILIILLLIYLIQKTGRIYKQNLSLENQLHLEQLSKVQLDYSMQTMENMRSWKHDYKNHLITMTGLLHDGKYTELSDYLQQLQVRSPDYLSNVSSGNACIDAIVTSKMQLAIQARVDFQYSIILPTICPLTDLELTAILGNLLDNSLEACGKLVVEHQKMPPPYIKLLIKPFRDMLQIQVVNLSDGKYRYARNGKLCTTKEETPLHGYGLKRITDIVKGAGGMLNIRPVEDKFTVDIFIPISEKKEA